MVRFWLAKVLAALTKRWPLQRRRSERTAWLLLEALEDRTVPSTFEVNELLDTHAVNLVSGMDACGQISLRSAIEAADHLGGGQTIQFDPGVFATPQTIVLTLGVLDLKGESIITLQGPGTGVAISGNQTSSVFRVKSGTTADLANMTICDGKITGDGGGILNAGTLTLRDSIVSGNTALVSTSEQGHGGRVYRGNGETQYYCYFGSGGGIANTGTLTLNNCTISGNKTEWNGAGLYNSASGTITLTDCTVSGNRFAQGAYVRYGFGGGIDSLGNASMTGCTVTGNRSTSGGGVCNAGTATLADSALSGNVATTGVGGGVCGVYNGITNLNNCTIANNAAWAGGGIGCPGEAAGSEDEPLTLTNCTVTGNKAVEGGGIYNGEGNEATSNNSTISANTASKAGGGMWHADTQ